MRIKKWLLREVCDQALGGCMAKMRKIIYFCACRKQINAKRRISFNLDVYIYFEYLLYV